MKCIKSIKATKNTEVGVFMRTSEIEAESKVKTGYWAIMRSLIEMYPIKTLGTKL